METLVIAKADEHGCPRDLALGMGIAESNLRTNARQPREAKDDASYWPDVSMGWAQQTVAFSPELQAMGKPWYRFPGADIVREIGDRYYDPSYAADVALPKLAGFYQNRREAGLDHDDAVMAALSRYNSGQWTIPASHAGNIANYQSALRQARQILS